MSAFDILKESHKVVVMIDGSNLYSSTKALNMRLDFAKLLQVLKGHCDLVRAYYFTAKVASDKETDPDPLVKILDWLEYNNYRVITKPAKSFKVVSRTTGEEYNRTKGDIDIEIVVEMIKISDHVDHIILFSGDGDFRRAVEHVQEKGVIVTVVSTLETDPSMVADELRRQADNFVELADLRDEMENVN